MKTRHLLYSLLIVLMFTACGTRKAKISNYKANVTTEEQSKLNVDSSEKKVEKVEEKKETKTKVENDITQKDVKTEVKEIFKDGELTERTTTTTISDKVDKSRSETNEKTDRKSSSIKETLKKIESKATKIVDSMIKSNSKDIDANTTVVKNVGGWVVLVMLFLVIVGSIWYWIKRRSS